MMLKVSDIKKIQLEQRKLRPWLVWCIQDDQHNVVNLLEVELEAVNNPAFFLHICFQCV